MSRDEAVGVLTGADLAPIVDFVAWSEGGDVQVAAHRADPIADETAYPDGVARLGEVFANPNAPDLIVVHTGAHHWPERGGHVGEHGSLNAEQSTAPCLVSGAGVTDRGVLDSRTRVRNTKATLLRLSGRTRHVVGLLWDGTHNADLLRLATYGILPNVARLLDRGCALRGGALAEFPSVSLTNHASALTGVGPSGHGIINNEYLDRSTGTPCNPNDADTWHRACDWLRADVETVFEALSDRRSAAINEPIDRGATYSTFAAIRDAGTTANALSGSLPDPTADFNANQRQVAADKDYAVNSAIDAYGLSQVVELWSDEATRPALTWWNTTLTDTAHHLGGPGSDVARAALLDSDRRLGVFLELVERLGLTDDTAILLTSDHGSQRSDPDCRGDWDEALRAAGIAFRDLAYGFIYLGE